MNPLLELLLAETCRRYQAQRSLLSRAHGHCTEVAAMRLRKEQLGELG
jgi:hypothetical protein